MRRHPEASQVLHRTAIIVLLFVISGCAGRHHLAEYQFSDKTLAMVFLEPPSPELLSGFYDIRPPNSPIEAAMRVGGGIAKEVEVRKASARLDSAVRNVDIPDRLAKRTLERVSLYLGTRPVDSRNDADYVLELNMRRFGIDARSPHAVYLYTRAEAVLVDRRSGREIWSMDVRAHDRLTPWVIGTRTIPSSIFSAMTIHNVSVAEFQEALDQLVTSSSNAITNRLRDRLRDVRDDR